MELSSSSSKRIKVESKPIYSDQQLVGSNLLDDVTSLDSSGSLNDSGDSDPDLNFEALRWSPTFVDKSMLITCVMKDQAHRVLLTAPPRFGKTMACNILELFFQIVNSEQELEEKYNLFKDLRIYKCTEESTNNHDCERKRFFRKHCGQHPVISLDFAQLSATSYGALLIKLRNMITNQFKKYMCLIHKDDDTYSWSNNNMNEHDVIDFLNYKKAAHRDKYWIKANEDERAEYIFRAFRYLFEVLSAHYHTKQTHKKIILLIDEFDAPFMELLFGEEKDERIITLLRTLMRLLCKDKMSAEFVQRVIIFSVTALGGMISLGANNVERRTFLDKDYDYYKFFGFTKEEVIALVERTVTESQRQKALDDISIWYNNYIIIGDKDTTICNPVSITKYLSKFIRKSYWSEKVGTKYVCELFKFEKMREKVFPAIRDNQNISINAMMDAIELNDVSNLKLLSDSLFTCINEDHVNLALQFLTECGYFNVIDKDDTTWTLQIPNLELKTLFRSKLHRALLTVKPDRFDAKQRDSFVSALKSLGCGEQHEPMQYVTFKESVENLYTNRELPKAHFHFYCDLYMLISTNIQSFSELPIKTGPSPRLDLMVITDYAAIIIEVKRHGQDSAKKALKQCIEKKYYRAFESMGNERKGLKKILMGLHLSDDGKVSIRYLENFEQNRITSIEKIVEEDSYEC